MKSLWSKLAVLSALAVSTLSLPGPDGAYNIPNVGTGRRSQYYVLHSDGTYKYGHDTGEGAFSSSKSSQVGQESGSFGYRDPDGNSVSLNYEAGEEGFVPRGDHLPEPHPDFHAAHAQARGRSPFIDPLADPSADASYNFDFQEDGQARSEQSDANGNVKGSFAYTDDEGRTRTYTYRAGSGTGFVITGDGIPQDSNNAIPGSSPSAFSSTGQQSSFTGSQASSVSSQNVASSASGVLEYSASSNTQSQRFPVEEARVRSSITPSGGHSFDYQTSSHSRAESSDNNNEVDGNFVFVADDGQRRTVQYEASSATGFTVEGDHLPRGPEVPGAPSGIPTGKISPVHIRPFFDPLANPNADASYDFSYREDEQARNELSNRDGTVRGSYSYVDDEGRRRTYTYTAGAGIGFRIEGDDLPPQEHSVAATSAVGTVQAAARNTLASSRLSTQTTSAVASTRSNAPSTSTSESHISASSTQSNNAQRSESSSAGGHTLNYRTPTHSRAESISGDNNVVGNFEFVSDDDGQRRAVQYQASSATGFTVEGNHLPIGPQVPGAQSGRPTGKFDPVATFFDPLADPFADASYDFNFESERYSRKETSDSNGNVQGTYTVVDEDGTRRTYRFRAGEGIGFETREISVTRGPRPAPLPSSGSPSSQLRGSSSAQFKGSSSKVRQSASSKLRGSSSRSAYATRSSLANQQQASASSTSLQRSSFGSSHTQDFNLQQYDASTNPNKFGYVLTFNN